MVERVVVVLAVQLLLVGFCHASGWWMDQPYESSSDFNVLAQYNTNVTLKCEDARLHDSVAYEFEYWIRPDLTVMREDDCDDFKTLDGTASWGVNKNSEMEIVLVQEEHFGFYHCIVYNAPEYIVIKKSVNYQGAHFAPFWEIYRLNVIIACSAAGGFILACVIIYVIHHYCFDHYNALEDISMDDNVEDNGGIDILVADDGYEELKRDVHLRSSLGRSAGSSAKSNSAYVVDPDSEDTTKL